MCLGVSSSLLRGVRGETSSLSRGLPVGAGVITVRTSSLSGDLRLREVEVMLRNFPCWSSSLSLRKSDESSVSYRSERGGGGGGVSEDLGGSAGGEGEVRGGEGGGEAGGEGGGEVGGEGGGEVGGEGREGGGGGVKEGGEVGGEGREGGGGGVKGGGEGVFLAGRGGGCM